MNDPGHEPSSTLTVTVVPDGGAGLVAAVQGEVDLATAPQLHAALTDAIAVHRPRRVTIDATAMTFLDAAGMGAFISVYHQAKVRRIEIGMENVQPSVMVPLRIVELVDFFDVTERLGG